jgi:hypothetical protein
LKIKSGYILREIADTYIVVPVGERVISFKGMMTLNRSGAYIWECLKNEITYENLLQKILDKYEVSKEIAAEDLDEFLAKARVNGVIEE